MWLFDGRAHLGDGWMSADRPRFVAATARERTGRVGASEVSAVRPTPIPVTC